MSKEIVKSNKDRITPVRFKPRARLLLQLGDQLIKNESIALVELVKNSYDADANVVTIYMENVDDPKTGVIIIEDDGYGMSADTVENVWLEPGSDFKTQKIKNLEGSPKYDRLPIGEKGIGRFGVHKLGNVIEMTTKSADTNEVYVKIDWTDFDNYKYLEDVPITIIERTTPSIFKNGKTGTNILIADLRKKWERGIAREVKRSITALASPFDVNDSFKPSYSVLDKPGWFEGLLNWEDVKDYSLFRFKITMEGSSITEFSYDFTPWASMTKLFPRLVGIEDLLIDQYKIGSVTFEGYIFDRDPFVLKLGVSDKTGFKKYLDTNGGVKVFRDKLRVYDYGEPENDWLGLDLRRVNQPAKRVSNNILLSAISINRKDSSDLIEKTNREGFLENQAYEAFRGAILHSLEIIETLRYQDKQKVREKYGPTPTSSPVMSTLSEAKNYAERKVKPDDVRDQIIKYFTKIESDYKTISNNLLKAAGAGLSMSVVVHEVEKIIYEVEKVLKSEKASERVLSLVKHLSSLIDGYAEIIRKSSQTSENISQVIDQALFNTEFRLASHKVDILKEYKSFKGKPKVKIAKNLVIGVVMNLIDNSIFWLDQRGFKATENKEKFSKKLFVNLVEEDKYLNLVIADNGTGFLIPTDDITEPFVTAKPGGMGLGLHIANEIMEAQNGRLIFPDSGDFELPNEFKKGATIVLSFKK
jgi:signal transduction histidine kinase